MTEIQRTRVSVIMPCFNAEDSLERAVASVLNQSYQDLELILVDDASTDSTPQLIAALCRKDTRIKSARLPSNQGAAAARNQAIDMASGRYLAFLDSDDEWLPEKLSLQVSKMQREKLDLCYGAYWVALPNGRRMLRQPPSTLTYERLLEKNHIGCLTAVYDRSRLGKEKMPALRKRQDYALWLKLLRNGAQAGGCAETLAVYHRRPASQSPSLSQNKLKSAWFNWQIYREIEGLTFSRSLLAFFSYGWRGFLDEVRLRLMGQSFGQPLLGLSLMLFLALHLWTIGPWPLAFLANIKLSPWDPVILLMIIVALYQRYCSAVPAFTASERETLRPLMTVALLFLFWISYKATASANTQGAVTMVLMLVRDYLLFFAVLYLGKASDLNKLNRHLFHLGTVIVFCAAPIFIWAMFNYDVIRHTRELWQTRIGYMMDDKFILRFLGFTGDPNFMSLFLIAPFVGVIQKFSTRGLTYGRHRGWIYLGLVIQLLALYFAFSRSVILGLIAAAAVSLLSLWQARQWKLPSWKLLLTVAAAAVTLLVLLPSHWILGRFTFIGESQRFLLWKKLAEAGAEHIWWGAGLRFNQSVLGKYSHNTYLDLLYETGLPGLALGLLLIAIVSWQAWKALCRSEYFPWAFTWFTLVVCLAGYSFLLNPFFWFVMALVMLSALRMQVHEK